MIDHLHSAIYTGHVRHRRFSPKYHEFNYRVFMMYFDLDELDKIFNLSPFWGTSKWCCARFKREDFHGHSTLASFADEVRDTVEEQLKERPLGPVRVLANWRYFGYNMNPLTTYYCFAEDGVTLHSILAEVNNTPWGEKHAYALRCDPLSKQHIISFEKDFSVSPFHPLNMEYRWLCNTPSDTLHLHIDNYMQDERVFDATLRLSREEMSQTNLNKQLVLYPFMTVKVIAAIYWQALKLLIKGVPFLGKGKDITHIDKNKLSGKSIP